jgi:hypothetical protein
MQTKAKIKDVLVDLAGPVPAGATVAQVETARRTLSWVLEQHGDKGFGEVVFGTAPFTPAPAPRADTTTPPAPPPTT